MGRTDSAAQACLDSAALVAWRRLIMATTPTRRTRLWIGLVVVLVLIVVGLVIAFGGGGSETGGSNIPGY